MTDANMFCFELGNKGLQSFKRGKSENYENFIPFRNHGNVYIIYHVTELNKTMPKCTGQTLNIIQNPET